MPFYTRKTPFYNRVGKTPFVGNAKKVSCRGFRHLWHWAGVTIINFSLTIDFKLILEMTRRLKLIRTYVHQNLKNKFKIPSTSESFRNPISFLSNSSPLFE